MTNKSSIRTLLLASCLAGFSAIQGAHAATGAISDSTLQAAGIISRTQAIAIARKAEPNAVAIAAVFEKSDSIPHWSVDLVGSVYEYEVWVSAGGSVLRIITQPK